MNEKVKLKKSCHLFGEYEGIKFFLTNIKGKMANLKYTYHGITRSISVPREDIEYTERVEITKEQGVGDETWSGLVYRCPKCGADEIFENHFLCCPMCGVKLVFNV